MDVRITSDAGRVSVLLEQRAQAMLDMRPALQHIAAEIERRTALSLHESKRQDGLPFQDLADSTKLARLRRRKGAFKKATKGGKLTAAQRRAIKRAESRNTYDAFGLRDHLRRQRIENRKAGIAAAIAAANFKPLVDTGRGRNSINARAEGKHAIRFSVIGYMVPHIGGGKDNRPPQRNFSCFHYWNGEWSLRPEMAAYAGDVIRRHIQGEAM